MAIPDINVIPTHLEQAAEVQARIYTQMSPADKIREAMRLREFAWEMKQAFLKGQYPEWSEAEIQIELRRIFLYATS